MLVTVDDGVFGRSLLPALNLTITQIIVMLITRITAIVTSPTSDARSGILLPNEVCVGTLLVGMCTEVLVMFVETTTVTADVVSVGVLTIVVILHSSIKS